MHITSLPDDVLARKGRFTDPAELIGESERMVRAARTDPAVLEAAGAEMLDDMDAVAAELGQDIGASAAAVQARLEATRDQDEVLEDAEDWNREVASFAKDVELQGTDMPDPLLVVHAGSKALAAQRETAIQKASLLEGAKLTGRARVRATALAAEGRALAGELGAKDAVQTQQTVALPQQTFRRHRNQGLLLTGLRRLRLIGRNAHRHDPKKAAVYEFQILTSRPRRRASDPAAPPAPKPGTGPAAAPPA